MANWLETKHMTGGELDATAARVRSGALAAREVVHTSLDRIAAKNKRFNIFTQVLGERAMAKAARIDAAVAAGADPGPLTGVPFAVKGCFDVHGLRTLSGSTIRRHRPPAQADAAVIATLEDAGAILVGTLLMDEFACGFTTENSHYGPCRNPWDVARICGGSSGGSAAAVAAGLVPLALGSDTNGSVRVPAALCGVFGFKPSFGDITRSGMDLFSETLDNVGIMCRSAEDLALTFDVLRPHGRHSGTEERGGERRIWSDRPNIRIAVLDGNFALEADALVVRAVDAAVRTLSVTQRVEVRDLDLARYASLVITAVEGSARHLHELRTRCSEFDPMTRPWFLAGSLVPACYYVSAMRFRTWFAAQVDSLLANIDVVVAPAVPVTAPYIGQRTLSTPAGPQPTSRYLGIYTMPFSLIGLPVVSVPIIDEHTLPVGVQLIGRRGKEDCLLAAASLLEQRRR